ncbi:MAG: SEC-C domain-containing protein [Planctomycetes bacterium]|nr:SEC-C domain-containing protein [Planctomycetota bacterium]
MRMRRVHGGCENRESGRGVLPDHGCETGAPGHWAGARPALNFSLTMTNLIQFPLPTLPDRLPAGFDHQIDRVNALTMAAFRLATRDEIMAAARAMGLAAGDGTIISKSETDNARVIEWTAFRVRRDGKTLIQVLLERMPDGMDIVDRAILSALATAVWSIYRIEEIRPRVGAVVVDLWRPIRQVIYSRTFQDGLQAGDAVMARRVAIGDLATMTALVSKIHEPFLDGLRKVPGFASDADIAQDQMRQELLADMVFAARPTDRQVAGAAGNAVIGLGGGNRQRNRPCPCGSGKKSKHCCARGR